MPRRALLVLLAMSAVGVWPGAALAGAPGSWTRVTEPTDSNIFQAGHARTADGVLHVAWLRKNGVHQDLLHTPISAAGALGTPTPIQSDWVSINNPSLLVDPAAGGLAAIFGGTRSLDGAETHSNMSMAAAPAAGAPWTLGDGDIASSGDDVGAAFGPGNVLFESWARAGAALVHRGIDKTTTNFDYQLQLGGCCGYSPGLAYAPTSGTMVLAWYSNATGRSGVWANVVDPATGGPIGSGVRMPGTVTTSGGTENSSQQSSRVPIAARVGGGIYVAYPGGYPVQTDVLLWRVGDATSTVIAHGAGAHGTVSLAPAPDGRLWVGWTESNGGPIHVMARRSNTTATAFEPAASFDAPAGSEGAFKLDLDAQADRVDVLAAFGSTAGTLSTWHTQLRPGVATPPGGGTYTGPTHTTTTVLGDQNVGIQVPRSCVRSPKRFSVRAAFRRIKNLRDRTLGNRGKFHAVRVDFSLDRKHVFRDRRAPYAARYSTTGLKAGSRHTIRVKIYLRRQLRGQRFQKLFVRTLTGPLKIC